MCLKHWADDSLVRVAEFTIHKFPEALAYTRHGHYSAGHEGGDYEVGEQFQHIAAEATQRGIELNIPNESEEEIPEDARQRLHWSDWQKREASQAKRAACACRILPDELAHLCHVPNASLARNADELLEAVIESIGRWEKHLAAGAWKSCWDLKPRKVRHETVISEVLRDWLKADLKIFAETEVKLSSQRRTDILVQANHPLYGVISTVVEMKIFRSNNRKERRENMKTQLLGYLNERQAEGWTHGLYVVAWTPTPNSIKNNNESTMHEEAAFLESQARTLTNENFTLRSMVVDLRYRGATPSKKRGMPTAS